LNVRAQLSMVFHLDKCVGCHTCSISCKNIWTDRKGAEYMWWNNVETKPGTGYPSLWEDQEKYRGGWEEAGKDGLRLKLQGRARGLGNLFHNPALPTLDDYYEPWTYDYQHLFNAPAGDDQPTARTISMITGKPMNVEAGPNWDDDLSGSPVYAENDHNLSALTDEERQQLFQVERLVFFYLPRICNHCLNPGCVAACPSGAIYKRGEDGIVLVSQDRCRAWRMCVSGCPYKKVYYNWATGKSEKCILCYPRAECGQAQACFHSCIGRIRYTGVLLYDADGILDAAKAEDSKLVATQRDLILDPHDPAVLASARASGVPEQMLEAAQKSPVYQFVKVHKLALPLHAEFRTLPMLFYVPPLLPVTGGSNGNGGAYRLAEDFFSSLDSARVPLSYLARLFAAGNLSEVSAVYRRLMAVRLYQRGQRVGDVEPAEVKRALTEADLTAAEAEAIYRLTSMPTVAERFVVPPMAREVAVEATQDPLARKGETGIGYRHKPERGW